MINKYDIKELHQILAKGLYSQEDIEKLFDLIPELQVLTVTEQHHPAHCYNVWEHTLETVRRLNTNHRVLLIAALLHDIGKPEKQVIGEDGFHHFWGHEEAGASIALEILNRLGWPKDEGESIVKLIRLHDTPIEASEAAVKEAAERHGIEFIRLLLAHQKADLRAHGKEYGAGKMPKLEKVEAVFKKLYQEKV